MKRIILYNYINGEKKTLEELGLQGQKVKRVWTILNDSLLNEENLEGITLKHNYNVFLEDKVHDWNIVNGYFKFYGHSGDIGEKHNLLIEVE